MNTIARILKKTLHKICFRIKLKSMDDIWYLMGGSCFGMFPPSFYYTHTEQEIERISAEQIDKIDKMQKMIAQLREIKLRQSNSPE